MAIDFDAQLYLRLVTIFLLTVSVIVSDYEIILSHTVFHCNIPKLCYFCVNYISLSNHTKKKGLRQYFLPDNINTDKKNKMDCLDYFMGNILCGGFAFNKNRIHDFVIIHGDKGGIFRCV
jgi:hypothetical protein